MKPISFASPLHSSALILFATLLSQTNSVFAQTNDIVPDNTLGAENSVVNPRDATSDSIEGGAVRGQNLFHSFEEFNVGEDRGVYFANPDAVSNIFSRVTGNSQSNILGTLGVDGAANLYLVNPNGIVFGENSSLDVQGSFTATTAEGIEFGEGGLFSAVQPGESLLTISVPLGLQFGSTPGSIVNRSFVEDETGDFVGLQVPDGEDLTLVGGEVRFEAGEATAKGGNINIGGLGTTGTVSFNDDGSLSFSEDVERADLLFTNAADVDVRGTGGGNININARNAFIEVGDFGSSQIRAGIRSDSISTEAQAGNIIIDATDKLSVTDSTILNKVDFQGVGNAGNIQININSLTLNDGGRISTTTEGIGNAGEIDITASNSIIIDGISADLDECVFCENSDGSNSGVFSLVDFDALGNAGRITISANSLTLANGGKIDATTSGQGNAGAIEITATNGITINDISTVSSRVNSEGTGNAAGITISTNSLAVTNGGRIDASTLGVGSAGGIKITATDSVVFDGEDSNGFLNSGAVSGVGSEATGSGGNIEIDTSFLTLTNGGGISTTTEGQGNAGEIKITATDTIVFDGETTEGFPSSAISVIAPGAKGDSGGITVSTDSLILTNGGKINASTFGQGNAGKIAIADSDVIAVDGEDSNGDPSGFFSVVTSDASGNSGGISITTGSLNFTNGGRINGNTFGQGDAGKIKIITAENTTFDGVDSDGFSGGAFSTVGSGASGDSGGISLTTDSLNLINGGQVNASTFGEGDAGAIAVNTWGMLFADGESPNGFSSGILSLVEESGIGDSGGIDIRATNIALTRGSRISASTLGEGNAGAVVVNADESISIDGERTDGFNSVISSVVAASGIGDSSGINLSTTNLSLTQGGQVNASTYGEGDAGAITVNASGMLSADGEDSDGFSSGILSLVEESGKGNSGGINLTTTNLSLTRGSRVSASTLGQGNAGAVVVNADESISIDGERTDGFNSVISSVVEGSGTGNSGGINLTTTNLGSLNLANGGQVNATTFGQGNAGNIEIHLNSLNLDNEALIVSRSETNFDAGNITLTIANSLQAKDSEISTSSFQSSGGNLTVTAGNIELRGNSDFTTNIASGEGSGGNIAIKADSILAFDDSDIFASAPEGRGGNITLNTPAFFAENFTLNSLTANPDELDLDLNNRADVNATGAVSSGLVSIPDVSFIQNSLTELPDNSINTDELVANSCVVPVGNRSQGKFIVTGGESLPVRPGDNLPSKYPTGEVRGASEDNSSWQPGDPIVEPQGAYRLANGKMVLSRECPQ